MPGRRAENRQVSTAPESSSGPSTGPSGASASGWPTASTRASSSCGARARPAGGSRSAGRATRCCGATPSRRATCSTWTGPLTGRSGVQRHQRREGHHGRPGRHNILQDIDVHHIGHEGIHLRAFSTGNLVQGNLVHDTGLRKAKYGEGVYVGSAHSNWCEHSGCKPDRSDNNRILGNQIGPDVTAEGVDLKEGTSSGLVSGNDFIGRNMTGADSWVDVKGNAWTVQGNRGSLSPQDGFQVHVEAPGWGRDNVITGNSGDLGADGEYGVRVDNDARGTRVGCDNRFSRAGKGLSNIPCP